MANNARKKEKHRLKRKQKQLALRRAQSVSPYRRIATQGQLERLLINGDWHERGQAVIWALRSAPGGGHAMAAFMIDLWCAGLKDAWGRLDVTLEEFEEFLDRSSQQLDFVETDQETIRHVVAGAIRFAVQNGFRLPARYERWVSLIGGAGDWRKEDLSDFGVEGGKLRWVAPLHDLRRRLIGSTVEEFMAREDVECIIGMDDVDMADEDWDEEEEDGDEDEEALDGVEAAAEMARGHALTAVRQWCFAHGEQPHPRLPEALDIMFESILQMRASAASAEPDAEAEDGQRNMAQLLSMERPAVAADVAEAIRQLSRYADQFTSGEDFVTAIGLHEEPEEDETSK